MDKFWRRRIYLIAAGLVIPIMWALKLAGWVPEGLSDQGWMMLSVLITAMILWITEALPYSISGLLIIILQPLVLFPDLHPEDVFNLFGNGAVFFLLGAFILAAALEKYNLHKRAALGLLRLFGGSTSIFLLGIMLTGTLLTFIMPAHGVVALLIPIVLVILVELRRKPQLSNFGKASVIGVAYGCSIGSLGTMIGGARNPLTVGFLLNDGIPITFGDWMVLSMPVVFITLPVAWVILIKVFPPEKVDLKELTGILTTQVKKLGPPGRQQYVVLLVLFVTVALWVLLSQELTLAVIALASAVALFVTRSLQWSDVERKVPWGILLLYGGAITLGFNLTEYGTAHWIADGVIYLTSDNPWILIPTLIALCVFLTNVMSNTAAVAMLMPISISLAQTAGGLSEVTGAMIVALSTGFAFVLVIATPGNLIAYSTGYFKVRDLAKAGILVTLFCILILFIVSMTWWEFVNPLLFPSTP